MVLAPILDDKSYSHWKCAANGLLVVPVPLAFAPLPIAVAVNSFICHGTGSIFKFVYGLGSSMFDLGADGNWAGGSGC